VRLCDKEKRAILTELGSLEARGEVREPADYSRGQPCGGAHIGTWDQCGLAESRCVKRIALFDWLVQTPLIHAAPVLLPVSVRVYERMMATYRSNSFRRVA
jgi:hypothetical protein